MSETGFSLQRYIIRIKCLNCNTVYPSNRLNRLKTPRRCKKCGSTRIVKLNYYEG